MSELDYDIKFDENPEISISELGARIENGTAFIIDATGISRKKRRELEKIAFQKLKGKKTPIEYHFVGMGDVVFLVVE